MEYTEIKKLIDAMGESKLTDLDIEFADGTKISMKKSNEVLNSANVNEQLKTNMTANINPNILQTAPVTQFMATVPATQAAEATMQVAQNAATNVAENSAKVVKAPMVGTFYSKSNPSADAFVQEGDRVEKGQTLCIIEAMKLMNEIEADYSGVVKKILVKDGEMVEYGQPLFEIEA